MIAFTIPPYSPLIAAVVLPLLLAWLRRPGRGGAIGRRVRFSDHQAWRDAVLEKNQELAELMEQEPKV